MTTAECPKCNGTGKVCDGSPDCQCDACREQREGWDDRPSSDVPRGWGTVEYRTWRKWMWSEVRRTGRALGNKGCVRRQRRACRRAFKRLSAMRRQGRV